MDKTVLGLILAVFFGFSAFAEMVSKDQVSVPPTVMMSPPQTFVLNLRSVSVLRVESGCQVAAGDIGHSSWVGIGLQNNRPVQVISVQFNQCTLLFGRVGTDSLYELVGDLAIGMDQSPIVFYSRYGQSLKTQIANVVDLILARGMPTTAATAFVEPQ